MDHPEVNVPRVYQVLRALAVALNSSIFCFGLLAAQSPFKGTPWLIPGTIEAENFDEGGEGISYYDTTPENEGGVYRTTAVDIFASTEATNGYYVGLREGEWLEFTVNVQQTDFYDVTLRTSLEEYGPRVI